MPRSSGSTIRPRSRIAATLRRIVDGYAGYVAALQRPNGDAAAIIEAFGRFRVLCALREGPRGVEAINAWVERALRRSLAASAVPSAQAAPAVESEDTHAIELDRACRRRRAGGRIRRHAEMEAERRASSSEPGRSIAWPLAPGAAWYPGRPVMVLRNDPVMKLFNGDVGIALPDATGRLTVCFADADGRLRRVAPQRLPPHQTAFAMTVHKAQGSEFDAVLVLLPAEPHRVVSRELLYTALTRARRQATVVAGAAVLTQAIESPTARHSGLLARLREAHER